jgi:rod shape-determining protein MreB and related proteins
LIRKQNFNYANMFGLHCPPELAGDIYGNGVYVTGGNALLRGLKDRLEKKIRLTVHIDKTPLHAVSKGVATTLRDPKKYRSVLMN